MFDQLHYFTTGRRTVAISLPFSLDEALKEWTLLRSAMARKVPAAFSRDEWAYLLAFTDETILRSHFVSTFGEPSSPALAPPRLLLRPRGKIAVWLPNNVSLLGPLTLILLCLTGNTLRLKGGSNSIDLTKAFLEFAREHAKGHILSEILHHRVLHETFDREDPRHTEMAATSDVQIVFGTDQAASAIHSLPHPIGSTGFSFTDRRSEAWIERSAITDDILSDVLRVFAIYGQAGCTSPRRVLILDASAQEATAVRDRMLELWRKVIRRAPPIHIASENVMVRQWAAAMDWDARLAENNGAMLATGGLELTPFHSNMSLAIQAAPLEKALSSLPSNIQTLGIGATNLHDSKWLHIAANSSAKRIVPVGRMHHFGPVWDGRDFWAQTFEQIELP